MKEIALQKRNGALHPFTDEDAAKLAEFYDNQPLKAKITGTRKERSWQQLKMLHSCIKTVSDNTDNPNWNTPEKAKFSLKIELDYINRDTLVVDKKGNVKVQYRSFGYDDLPHAEACHLFDRAWPILAGVIGVSVDELLAESRANDQG